MRTLIVGGTSGIGRVIAEYREALGHSVTVFGRRAGVDLTDPASLRRALEPLHGEISHLVICQRARTSDPHDEWRISVDATVEILQWAWTGMQRDGAIVLIGSVAATHVIADQGADYHGAKGALLHLMRYFAVRYGYTKNLRVNMVSPGMTVKPENANYFSSVNDRTQRQARTAPLGRFCTAEDIASAVEFLLSDNAKFITGQNLVMDGGASLQDHEAIAEQFALRDEFGDLTHDAALR